MYADVAAKDQDAGVRVGVDFGTSMSGYTYAVGSKGNIRAPRQYTEADDPGVPKTFTAILYQVHHTGTWSPMLWGREAIDEYLRSGRDPSYRLIEGKHFKLRLCKDENWELPSDFDLPSDCPLTYEDVTAQYLTFLTQHISSVLRLEGLAAHSASTSYCLSVPAGWSPQAKDIMRRALGRALGTAAIAGDKISVVYEPESAAVTACHDKERNWQHLQVQQGDVWMVVDAGGGTVDLTMHRVEPATAAAGKCRLSEVFRSDCLPLGSSRLDERAEETIIKPLFSSHPPGAFEAWKRDHHHSYRSQMEEWEKVKRRFTGQKGVVMNTATWLQQHLGAPDYLNLTAQELKEKVFDPVFDRIIEKAMYMLSVPRKSDGHSKADVLIIVGGLGSNRYFAERLTAACRFYVRQQPCCPADVAAKAVVMGNTIHLQHPGVIMARVSRLSYGLGIATTPGHACHKLGSVFQAKGGKDVLCHNHFHKLVTKGDVVELGNWTKPCTVTPQRGSAAKITLSVSVYSTEAEQTDHLGPHMTKVGEVKINVQKIVKKFLGIPVRKQASDDYKIDLQFRFGAAQFEVKAYDRTTGDEVMATVEFVSDKVGRDEVILDVEEAS